MVDHDAAGEDGGGGDEAREGGRDAVGHAVRHLDADVPVEEPAVADAGEQAGDDATDHALAGKPGLVEAGDGGDRVALGVEQVDGDGGRNEDQEQSDGDDAGGQRLKAVVLCPLIGNAQSRDKSDNLERRSVALAERRHEAGGGDHVGQRLDGQLEQQQVDGADDNQRHGVDEAVLDGADRLGVDEPHDGGQYFVTEELLHVLPLPLTLDDASFPAAHVRQRSHGEVTHRSPLICV